MSEAPNSIDRKTWNTLLAIDPDIARAAAQLSEFGERYVDDLAESYLAIGEKRYLRIIVDKLRRQAEDEARPASAPVGPTTNSGLSDAISKSVEEQLASVVGSANSAANSPAPGQDEAINERSAARWEPEFDASKWNELAFDDPDIAAAIAKVQEFGRYYVADLAASYLAIGDKDYLQRIVDKVIAEAKADVARIPNPAAARLASVGRDKYVWVQATGSAKSPNAPVDDARIETRGFDWRPMSASRDGGSGSSAESVGAKLTARAEQSPKIGARMAMIFGALGVLLILMVGTAGITLYEYSVFRGAHGDVDRLAAYENQCRVCAFKNDADAELTSLKQLAAERENTRAHEAAIAEDAKNFRDARGDIVELETYLSECEICAFTNEAHAELTRLKQAAAERETDQLREAATADDAKSFQAARGDIDRLRAYLSECKICAFRNNAEAEVSVLQQQANFAAAQAEIARQQEEQRQQAQPPLAAPPPPNYEPPHNVSWKIVNNTGLLIGVEFFSMTRFGQAWPGSNRNWPMGIGTAQDYNLECISGEKICFGAFTQDNSTYWGVGMQGNQGCTNCCFTCDGGNHINTLIAGSLE